LNIYLLTQKESEVDTYKSAVVVARDEDAARLIHPDPDTFWDARAGGWMDKASARKLPWWLRRDWPASPVSVSVELLGVADPQRSEGLVVSSYRAG